VKSNPAEAKLKKRMASFRKRGSINTSGLTAKLRYTAPNGAEYLRIDVVPTYI
jgi:hypothetical protein